MGSDAAPGDDHYSGKTSWGSWAKSKAPAGYLMCGAEVEYTPSTEATTNVEDWYGIIGLKIHWCNKAKWTDVRQSDLESSLSDNVSG
jgi:hypothetical protein